MTGFPRCESALAGLAVATLFRGAAAQLRAWIDYHLSAGASGVYVVLDRPDGPVDELSEDSRVVIETIDRATWQRYYPPEYANVERKQVDAFRWVARRAESDGHEQLALVDVDEVIDLAVPFSELTARHPRASALTLPPREMWFAEGDDIHRPFGATLAVRPEVRGAQLARTLGWRAQYLSRGMMGHDAGKSIYRLPLRPGALSVHGPLTGQLRAGTAQVTDDEGRVLHFDAGSVEAWNAKWASRLTGATLATGLAPHRRAQQQLFARVLRRPGVEQEAFFAELFTLADPARTRLEAAGVVSRVDLASTGVSSSAPLDAETVAGALVRLPTDARVVDLQFALVCDANFVAPTFATMVSVLAKADPGRTVRFVVLGDRLGEAEVRALRSLERCGRDVEVLVRDVTPDLDRDVGREGHRRARATYGRVYLVDHLPEQRTVYLDGDILATRDISELFELPLGDACIAGVPDSAALRMAADPDTVPAEQRLRLLGAVGDDPLEYLNAGVLVLAVEHPDFRELALRSRAHVALEGRTLAQHDQDAINLAFAGRKHRLPSTYNYMTQFYTSERCVDAELVTTKYGAADAALVHFSGKVKPWLSRTDEFYNGLYRRLVTDAERELDVTCGFYFSRPAPAVPELAAEEWAEALVSTTPPRAVELTPRSGDLELIDITDGAAYLRIAPASHALVVGGGHELVLRTPDAELVVAPLDRVGAPQVGLSIHVARAIRRVPLSLADALAAHAGVVHDVEAVVRSAPAGGRFERSLGSVGVVATQAASTPSLLDAVDVDGLVEESPDGGISGWYTSPPDVPVCLTIGDELIAWRNPRPAADGRRPFRFNIARLVDLGHGSAHDRIAVRPAGTNVALPGAALTVGDVRAAASAADLQRRSPRLRAAVRRVLRRVRSS